MLDINYIREHAEELKQAITNKQLNPEIVDAVLISDEQRRKLIVQVEELRQRVARLRLANQRRRGRSIAWRRL